MNAVRVVFLGGLLAALLHPGAVAAHVIAAPQFVYAGERVTLRLSGPNERDRPMTGFAVAVADGLKIVGADAMPPWEAQLGDGEARWTGGKLAPGATIDFAIEVEGPSTPRTASIVTRQLYPGGEQVEWPLSLTVTPARDTPPQHVWRAVVAALVGLLVTAAVVALAWRRRTGTLQEE
jgi:hypothetical protein